MGSVLTIKDLGYTIQDRVGSLPYITHISSTPKSGKTASCSSLLVLPGTVAQRSKLVRVVFYKTHLAAIRSSSERVPRPHVRVKRSKNMYISGFESHIIRTWLSRPTVNNIKKKRTDHSCGIGNVDNASGYTMNAIPGPVENIEQ